MSNALSANQAIRTKAALREKLGAWTPRLAIAPGAVASVIYVFGFTLWTLYISMSNSTMLPTYKFVGLKPYFDLWSNERWKIAYGNLFYFSAFYVVLSLAVGLALAIAIDQRVRGEAIWRTIFLYPLAVSFVVTGVVWSWLYSPDAGIEFLVRSLGWHDFTFRLITNRYTAIYAIIATGVWQSSGFAMALFLAGLQLGRSGSHQGGADRRRRAGAHLSQGDPAVDRADLRRGRGRAAAIRHQDLRSRGRAHSRRTGHIDDLSGELRL